MWKRRRDVLNYFCMFLVAFFRVFLSFNLAVYPSHANSRYVLSIQFKVCLHLKKKKVVPRSLHFPFYLGRLCKFTSLSLGRWWQNNRGPAAYFKRGIKRRAVICLGMGGVGGGRKKWVRKTDTPENAFYSVGKKCFLKSLYPWWMPLPMYTVVSDELKKNLEYREVGGKEQTREVFWLLRTSGPVWTINCYGGI